MCCVNGAVSNPSRHEVTPPPRPTPFFLGTSRNRYAVNSIGDNVEDPDGDSRYVFPWFFFTDLLLPGMLVGKVELSCFCEGIVECHGFEENIKIF